MISNEKISNEKITEILASDDTTLAHKTVTEALSVNPSDDGAYYCLGRLLWKEGDRTGAIAAYSKAVDLNPQSRARHALEMARSVLDFFNPDLLNP